ncbi:hypothetical protein [Streptomyces lancefieldiae]|uniref:Uncharacterized protein n=1 Tax=Streptomyces lancefieldiae TaxID=3075520 RepID=A0ABU3AG49_9ACTN|nr:hypothetical protein [Streptomyces sp. DSM 40712]MDT0608780.1 hypothetical protein [Streptomyces sp. DSM 40712]
MSANLYGPISLNLADGPVRVDTSRGADGRQQARLILGDSAESVAISVTDSPAKTLAQVQEVVAQAVAWQQRQQLLAGLPEVA